MLKKATTLKQTRNRHARSEADLGMFGRTGAPTKRGPPQKHRNFFFIFLQHGNKPGAQFSKNFRTNLGKT